MSTLLPNRHPNKDFFILDIQDAKPKDDMASMEHPIFSLSKKPDMRELEYTSPSGDRLVVIPSGRGLATIMDKDILLYCISKLVDMKNKGQEISQWVEFTAHEAMVATNWNTENKSYQRFEEAFVRLKGTVLKTNIETGNEKSSVTFGLIEYGEIIKKLNGEDDPFGRMSKVRVKLSDWMFRAVNSNEVLTISPTYFRLRRPLERRLYEIARKHVGNSKKTWTVGLKRLQEKVGSNAPLKKFRFNLKEIIKDDNIPDFLIELNGDNVAFTRKFSSSKLIDITSYIPLRPDTLDKAQVIAAELGVSVFDLEREWNEWASKKTEPPKNADAAFIAFCNKKKGSDGAKRVVEARQMAML